MGKVLPFVKVAIKHQGRFIVCRSVISSESVWDLPGAQVYFGETPLDALSRGSANMLDTVLKKAASIDLFWCLQHNNQEQVLCNLFECDLSSTNFASKFGAEEYLSHDFDTFTQYKFVTLDEFLLSKARIQSESMDQALKKIKL